MASGSQSLSSLLEWCSVHGIRIDPRLEIKQCEHSGISVFSREGVYIEHPTTLVQIPKSAILSVRTCSASRFIEPVPSGHGALLALSLALYIELLEQDRSRWFGYLQSLPQRPVDIAALWGSDLEPAAEAESNGFDGLGAGATAATHDRQRDTREALAWLRGTEVEKQLRGSSDTGQRLLDEVRGFHYCVALPVLEKLCGNNGNGDNNSSSSYSTRSAVRSALDAQATLGGFYHAYSLVSSRAFLVDAYHGLAMVPIADAFNHASENHVQLETDYDVCPLCGSLVECPHDEDDGHEASVAAVSVSGKCIHAGLHSTCSKSDGGDANYRTSAEANSGVTAPMRTGRRDAAKSDSRHLIYGHDAVDDAQDYCEMVSSVPIVGGSEVFNTYGARLSNAQLLVRYGFVLDVNENDCLVWEWEDLARFAQDWIFREDPVLGAEHGRGIPLSAGEQERQGRHVSDISFRVETGVGRQMNEPSELNGELNGSRLLLENGVGEAYGWGSLEEERVVGRVVGSGISDVARGSRPRRALRVAGRFVIRIGDDDDDDTAATEVDDEDLPFMDWVARVAEAWWGIYVNGWEGAESMLVFGGGEDDEDTDVGTGTGSGMPFWCEKIDVENSETGSHGVTARVFGSGLGCARRQRTVVGHGARINGEGKMSAGLWLFCVMVGIWSWMGEFGGDDGDVREIIGIVRGVADLQMEWEGEMCESEEEVDMGWDARDDEQPPTRIGDAERRVLKHGVEGRGEREHRFRGPRLIPGGTVAERRTADRAGLVRMVVRVVVALCASRRAGLGKSAEFDVGTEDSRSGVAYEQALFERSLLDSVECMWLSLLSGGGTC